MRSVNIDEITTGPDGCLMVKPALPADKDYRFIWRDASSVRWDARLRCLFVLDIEGFVELDYLRQIIVAVKNEYGDELTVCSGTAISGPPEPVQQQMRQYGRKAEPGNRADRR